MKLYLVQHGLAVDKATDADRPLSDIGVEEVEAMASWLYKTDTSIAQIYHSGKTRAQQTACIFSSKLSDTPVEAIEGIQPNDDVTVMLSFSRLASETVIPAMK